MFPARFSSTVLRDPVTALRNAKPLLTALGGIFAILLTVIVGLHSSGAQDPDREMGSSADYVAPLPGEQARLDTIGTDLNLAVKALRADEFEETGVVSPPLVLDPTLQIQADRWAKSNAVEGRESAIDRNVSMLQVNLPSEEASAEALISRILGSPAHTDVLLDPEMTFYGIGVARGHERVWAVLLFSAADADLDEPAVTGPAGSSQDS